MILNKKLENYWLILLSLPSWECGLKYSYRSDYATALYVAPFVGVWWECGLKFKNISIFISVICRSLCGSVDWNHHVQPFYLFLRCRSLCGSVDWNLFKDTDRLQSKVAPFVGVWIEIMSLIVVFPTPDSRSLRGSVDWNFLNPALNAFTSVAPFVGVWIEIYSSFRCWSLS